MAVTDNEGSTHAIEIKAGRKWPVGFSYSCAPGALITFSNKTKGLG